MSVFMSLTAASPPPHPPLPIPPSPPVCLQEKNMSESELNKLRDFLTGCREKIRAQIDSLESSNSWQAKFGSLPPGLGEWRSSVHDVDIRSRSTYIYVATCTEHDPSTKP